METVRASDGPMDEKKKKVTGPVCLWLRPKGERLASCGWDEVRVLTRGTWWCRGGGVEDEEEEDEEEEEV